MRDIILLDRGWQFVKEVADAGAACEAVGAAVTLPHTWNAVDGQDGGNDYYRGTCWYTRKLNMASIAKASISRASISKASIGRASISKASIGKADFAGVDFDEKDFAEQDFAEQNFAGGDFLANLKANREVWLEFCGAAMTTDVWLNGELLAHHEGGYSTFRVNLTNYLQEENQLAVSVDNSDNDRVYPQKADFTFYGGLYREVNLIVVPKAHFALGYVGGSGIKVTPEVRGCSARVTAEAWVEGPAERVCFTMGEQSQEAAVSDGYAQAVFTIDNVHLWDGIYDPYLYTITAAICEGRMEEMPSMEAEHSVEEGYSVEEGLSMEAGHSMKEEYSMEEKSDVISTRFGCRTIAFDPQKGFILNGREYPLRGVSRHQDRLGAGNALTKEMHEEDLAIIREMGANTIRLAHYQHSQYFYELCDTYGMIVWAEIPYITRHMPNGRENTLSQMKELVVQNYNHPSIVCWGLSNEITASGGVTEDLMENHRLLNDLCHSLDSTRPTTMAHVFMLETDSPLLAIPDIGSYNLYFGWYLGELNQNDSFFDAYHESYPDRCIGFAEYGADANPAFQSPAPERGDYTETYQTLYHEHILNMIEERPYLWATHVWNMFDFAADGRDEGGKNGQNQKGLVTMDRKLKKDAFYLYKAHWSKEPFVHVCGSRYVDRAEEVTEVKVYSNQPEISLYVDGELFETQSGRAVFCFMVPISGSHRIEAKAGELHDGIIVRKVEEPNPDYRFGTTGDMINWFDKEDFKEGYFSIRDTMAVLQSNPQAGAIVGAMMAGAAASRGDVAESVKDNPNLVKMMGAMTLESLLKQAGDAVSPEQVKALNGALQQIQK